MMRTVLHTALLIALSVTAPALARAPKVDYAAAVAFKDRPVEAVAMDASRRPAEVLEFMGLKPGTTAIDILTGSGYYAEIMARIVGPKGRVVAYQPAPFHDARSKDALAGLVEREPNTTVATTPAAFAPAGYDFAMIHLNYHDFYWGKAKNTIFRGPTPMSCSRRCSQR